MLFFVVANCGLYKEGLIIEALDLVDLLNLKAFLNVKEESHALDKGELVIRRIWKDTNLSKYGGTCTSWSVWDKWSLIFYHQEHIFFSSQLGRVELVEPGFLTTFWNVQIITNSQVLIIGVGRLAFSHIIQSNSKLKWPRLYIQPQTKERWPST